MERLARGMQCLRLSEALEAGDVSSPDEQRRLKSVGQYLDSVCKAGRYFRTGDLEGCTTEDYESFLDNHAELLDSILVAESGEILSYLSGHVARIEHILKTGSVDDTCKPLRNFCSTLGQAYVNGSYYDTQSGDDDNGLYRESGSEPNLTPIVL
ncbi:hypothetical protein HOC80_02525 [archaeon]|jgi:hypothetical protein|nr:hypothetical protein [archaeon]MBT4416955.1 hypothetical protein [archaeon]